MPYSLQDLFSNYHLIDPFFQGANILLAHFHRVSKGYAPFSIDWELHEIIVLAQSNEEGVCYATDVIQATKHQGMLSGPTLCYIISHLIRPWLVTPPTFSPRGNN